jgi:hypothetical protein
VYVERHLPPRFAPGYTLGDGDVQELKRMLARRDQHLQRLYHSLERQPAVAGQSWFGRLETRLARQAHAFEAATSIPLTPPLRALRRFLRRGADRSG